MTKLYNFSIIEEWKDCPQRLHAGIIKFKNNAINPPILELLKQKKWEDADLRCVHAVFMKRSSKERCIITTTRLNPAESMSAAQAMKNNDYVKYLRKSLKSYFRLDWKNKKYRKGRLVEKNISYFI